MTGFTFPATPLHYPVNVSPATSHLLGIQCAHRIAPEYILAVRYGLKMVWVYTTRISTEMVLVPNPGGTAPCFCA